MEVDCVSHRVRLDCVILLSNSINRARARPRCGYVWMVIILSVVHRHERISVMMTEERVDSYASYPVKSAKNTSRGQGTPVMARVNWPIPY